MSMSIDLRIALVAALMLSACSPQTLADNVNDRAARSEGRP